MGCIRNSRSEFGEKVLRGMRYHLSLCLMIGLFIDRNVTVHQSFSRLTLLCGPSMKPNLQRTKFPVNFVSILVVERGFLVKEDRMEEAKSGKDNSSEEKPEEEAIEDLSQPCPLPRIIKSRSHRRGILVLWKSKSWCQMLQELELESSSESRGLLRLLKLWRRRLTNWSWLARRLRDRLIGM